MQYNTKLFLLFLAVTSQCFLVAPSFATPVQYSLEMGHQSLNFGDGSHDINRDFKVTFGLFPNFTGSPRFNWQMSLDTDSGTAEVIGTAVGAVVNRADGSERISEHDVVETISLVFTGLDIEVDPVSGEELIAIGRPGPDPDNPEAGGAVGRATISLESEYFIQIQSSNTIEFEFDVMAKYFDGSPLGSYGAIAEEDFNLFVGAKPGQRALQFITWLGNVDPINIGGQDYNVRGDIVARVTEIPEPATATLLGIALLGAAKKRKLR